MLNPCIKKKNGKEETKERRQKTIATSVKGASGDDEETVKPDDALSDGKVSGSLDRICVQHH